MGAERRGRVVRGCVRSINQKFSGRSRVDELKLPGKPFEISKRAVWEAWEKVRANKGDILCQPSGAIMRNYLMVWLA
jgi:hypothetical protein